jgi:antitoxin ParD1/3/4
MPTRNVNLTAEQDAFVEDIVRAGKYQNASEAMRDALRGLLKAGLDALERDTFTDVEDDDLDAALDHLAAPATR